MLGFPRLSAYLGVASGTIQLPSFCCHGVATGANMPKASTDKRTLTDRTLKSLKPADKPFDVRDPEVRGASGAESTGPPLPRLR